MLLHYLTFITIIDNVSQYLLYAGSASCSGSFEYFPVFLSQGLLKREAATKISLRQKKKLLNIAIICLQSIPDVIFCFLKVLKDV